MKKIKLKINKVLKEIFNIDQEVGQVSFEWSYQEDRKSVELVLNDKVHLLKFKKEKLEDKGFNAIKYSLEGAELILDFPKQSEKVIPVLIRQWAKESDCVSGFGNISKNNWLDDLKNQRKKFIEDRMPLAKEVLKNYKKG